MISLVICLIYIDKFISFVVGCFVDPLYVILLCLQVIEIVTKIKKYY